METLVWFAVNALRWLVVLALLSYFQPPLRWNFDVSPPASAPFVVRTYQLEPCAPWSQDEPWSGGHICLTWPGARHAYLKSDLFSG